MNIFDLSLNIFINNLFDIDYFLLSLYRKSSYKNYNILS